MFRSIFKVALLVIAGVVCYNYFWGNAAEKEQSHRIFKGVGNVFGEVRDLVRSERKKFDGGKYDAALDKMGGVLDKLKTHNTSTNGAVGGEIAALEAQKKKIDAQLAHIKSMPDDAPASDMTAKGGKAKPAPTTASKLEQAAQLARQMEELNAQIQGVVNKVASPEDQQPY
ncbi:MAG: hypothetical protein RL757_2450 [Bacteroidota bacterium]|jgi:hypothetical protein